MLKTVSTVMIPHYSYNDFTNLILADLDAAEALFKDHDPLFTYSFQELIISSIQRIIM